MSDTDTIIDAVAKGWAFTVCMGYIRCRHCSGDGEVEVDCKLHHTPDCPVTLARKIRGLEPNDVTEC